MTSENQLYSNPEVYDMWAKVSRAPTEDEVEIYSEIATQLKLPIVELGSGSGRLLLPLAQKGHHVTGIDSSEEMISVSKSRAESIKLNIDFILADYRNFSVKNESNLVLLSCNGLDNLHNYEDLSKFFSCVHQALGSRGVLVLDQYIPEWYSLVDGSSSHTLVGVCKSNSGSDVELYQSSKYNIVSQIQNRRYTLHSGGRVQSFNLITKVYFPQEIDFLIRLFGLQVREKWGGLKKEPFDDSSTRQIILCSKL